MWVEKQKVVPNVFLRSTDWACFWCVWVGNALDDGTVVGNGSVFPYFGFYRTKWSIQQGKILILHIPNQLHSQSEGTLQISNFGFYKTKWFAQQGETLILHIPNQLHS